MNQWCNFDILWNLWLNAPTPTIWVWRLHEAVLPWPSKELSTISTRIMNCFPPRVLESSFVICYLHLNSSKSPHLTRLWKINWLDLVCLKCWMDGQPSVLCGACLMFMMKYCLHCSAVQCSAVQCSAVWYGAVQCSAVQCSAKWVHFSTDNSHTEPKKRMILRLDKKNRSKEVNRQSSSFSVC